MNGAALGLFWALPFAALLLAIAFAPLAAPRFWHHHYGKVALACALGMALPAVFAFGAGAIFHALLHTLLEEYLPFVILLTALFTVSGGLAYRGNLHGSPALNTALLALGALLASFMGTTGAAMLLVRPLLNANDNRTHNAHVFIFFIFLVGNIGGSLTPLGDPPLFLGYLQGVDFFWPLLHLWRPALLLMLLLLLLFFLVDGLIYLLEGVCPYDPTPDDHRGWRGIIGWVNVPLLMLVVALTLLGGKTLPWLPWPALEFAGVVLEPATLLRDAGLLLCIALSLKLTPRAAHRVNHFHFGPMREVALLFFGIFISMIPVLAMLRAASQGGGALAALAALAADQQGQPSAMAYFWLSGALSSVLDNAPTYLAFFHMAGGDAGLLMQERAPVLAAISLGAVCLGAMTYIGNAPNLMVRSVVEHRGVKMPGFLGYLLWSGGILLPLFLLASLLEFAP